MIYHTACGELGFEAVENSSGWNLSICIPEGMRLTLVIEGRSEEFTGPVSVNKALDVNAWETSRQQHVQPSHR
jgi:hypothetical protein